MITTKVKNSLVLGADSKASLEPVRKTAGALATGGALTAALMPVGFIASNSGATVKVVDQIAKFITDLLSTIWSEGQTIINIIAFVALLWNIVGIIYSKMSNNPQAASMKKENIKGVILAWGFFYIIGYIFEDVVSLENNSNHKVTGSTPWAK